jgi:hypothetical protein
VTVVLLEIQIYNEIVLNLNRRMLFDSGNLAKFRQTCKTVREAYEDNLHKLTAYKFEIRGKLFQKLFMIIIDLVTKSCHY